MPLSAFWKQVFFLNKKIHGILEIWRNNVLWWLFKVQISNCQMKTTRTTSETENTEKQNKNIVKFNCPKEWWLCDILVLWWPFRCKRMKSKNGWNGQIYMCDLLEKYREIVTYVRRVGIWGQSLGGRGG